MTDIKSALASKTVWATLIGLVVSLTGLGLDVADQAALAQLAVDVVAGISFLLALHGRLTATKRIG